MTCDDLVKYLDKWDKWTLERAKSFSTCREKCPMSRLCERLQFNGSSVPCEVLIMLGHALGAVNIKRIPR